MRFIFPNVLLIAFTVPTAVLAAPAEPIRHDAEHYVLLHQYADQWATEDKYPDWKPARGMPYEDVENLRPETKQMVETWLKVYGDAKDVILGVEAAGN